MLPIRKPFKDYLLSKGYTEKQIKNAWKKIMDALKGTNYEDQELTREVLTRDELEGEFDLEDFKKHLKESPQFMKS